MKPIVFLPEAEQDMLDAVQYYESQAPDLGLDYLSEVERAVHSISTTPETWPIVEGNLHRRLIRRFPCGILYKIDPDEIIIVAVAHLRKRPGYWKSRLKT